MEGLQICPSSIKIMSVRNTSGNTSNAWNKMNYTEELGKTKNFILAHDMINSKIWALQWGGETLGKGNTEKPIRWNGKHDGYDEIMRTRSGKLSSLTSRNYYF